MAPKSSAEIVSTRDRIVDTALKLFSERGPASVSVRELAEAAGVTVPGLYYHFASKAEIIRAVFEVQGLSADDDLDEGPRATTVEARIVEQARREFQRMVEHGNFQRLMHQSSILGDPDALEAGAVLRERWLARWHQVIGGSNDLASGVDVDEAAEIITTFLWGLFVEYLGRPERAHAGRIAGFARMIAPSLRKGGR